MALSYGEVGVSLSFLEATAAIEALEASLQTGWGSDNEARDTPGIGEFKAALGKLRTAIPEEGPINA